MCGLLYIDFNLAGWVDISDFDIIVVYPYSRSVLE